MNKENDRKKLVAAWAQEILSNYKIVGVQMDEAIINLVLQTEAGKLEKLWLLAQFYEAQDADTWDPSFEAVCRDLLAIYYPDPNPDLQPMMDMDINNWKSIWDTYGDTEDRPVGLIEWTVEIFYNDHADDFNVE